jgi:hypothetical protein
VAFGPSLVDLKIDLGPVVNDARSLRQLAHLVGEVTLLVAHIQLHGFAKADGGCTSEILDIFIHSLLPPSSSNILAQCDERGNGEFRLSFAPEQPPDGQHHRSRVLTLAAPRTDQFQDTQKFQELTRPLVAKYLTNHT